MSNMKGRLGSGKTFAALNRVSGVRLLLTSATLILPESSFNQCDWLQCCHGLNLILVSFQFVDADGGGDVDVDGDGAKAAAGESKKTSAEQTDGDAKEVDTENVENLSETPKEENRDDSDQ